MRFVSRLTAAILIAWVSSSAYAQDLGNPGIGPYTLTDFENISEGYIDAEGREWLPIRLSGAGDGNLFADMTAKCNALTGYCGDQWNSVQWATLGQVAQVFSEITGQPLAFQSNDALAAAQFESVFGETIYLGFHAYYTGVTRDAYQLTDSVEFGINNLTTLKDSGYVINSCATALCSDPMFTAFKYVAVPEPAGAGLLGAGVAAIFFLRRRRAIQ